VTLAAFQGQLFFNLAVSLAISIFTICTIDANQAGASTYEAAPQAFQLIEIGASSPMTLTIYFANNSWVLSTSSKSQLHTMALGMKVNGLTNVTITGYANSTGASTHNKVLGTHRAGVTAAYLKALLVQLGAKKTAIVVSGKGASNFVAYPSSVAANRRASIRAT
jgi:outer membrane protein OmpA-like peptidoglycan-associated protein